MTTSDQSRTAARPDPASRAEGPTFTLVIASSGARPWLVASLASLVPQCLRNGTELIVTRADPPGALPQLSSAYPYVRFISAPPRTSLTELRSAGLAAATGDVIALLDDADDRAIFDDLWLDRLRWGSSLDADPRGLEQAAVSATALADAAAQTGTVQLVPHTSPLVMDKVRQPYLSVVVPVCSRADLLRHALESLAGSDLPRTEWELIVVDDASTDASAQIAAQYADIVIRLAGRPRGPAYARNRGFEFARSEYIAFIDSDVCVHRDTLAQFVLVLSREPDISAVFGSFDAHPPAHGLVSQYRSLLAHYYHQEHPGPAETFWASCGAIRRRAFVDAGMFDEWRFSRRQVEDFELGYQLRERGHGIVLRPEIQATDLQRWTIRRMIAAELYDRSVPWMRIFDRRATTARRRTTRLRTIKGVNTAMTWLALVSTLGALVASRWWLPLAAACLLTVLFNDRAQHRFFAQQRGWLFALAVIPLRLLSYLVNGLAVTVGWALRELMGEPTPHPTVEAFAEVGVKMWPPVPAKRVQHAAKAAVSR
jgi:hypothetical protein